MDPRIIKEYRRVRAGQGQHSNVSGGNHDYVKYALRLARLKVAFVDADDLVELHVVPDEDMYDDSYLDTHGLSERRLARERKELWDRIDRDGVWIVVGRYRLSEGEPWVDVDSCGGFIGQDWKDSGYDTDIMSATLDALADAQLRARAATFEVTEPVAEGWA